MNLIDTHFHLDFYKDHKKWYEYINASKQYTLCVTNSPEIFYSCKNIYSETKYLKFALGYNPKTITKNKFNMNLFNHMLSGTKYIGEVGLDFTGELKEYRIQQIEVFDYICSAISKDQILSVHSKNAESDVLQLLTRNNVKKAILHWYSGNISTLKELVDSGYYFSINCNMINSRKGQDLIRNIPISRLLIESDGPFSKVNSQKFVPQHLSEIYDQLSLLTSCSNINEIILRNFKTLLS